MRDDTRRAVDGWWRAVFDIGDELWSSVTVLHPHRHLGDYEGWYVAWRGTGVHISAPSTADADEVTSLRNESTVSLQAADYWRAFAHLRGLDVIGPGVHHYLDDDPGPANGVREVPLESLRELRDEVSDDDWWESGLDDALTESGAVAFATEGGGAVLDELAGAPRNIGVLVTPAARGRGLGTELGRAAASYAVREHGYARWRCRDLNVASSRAAEHLGFERYASQLAVRRAK